MLHEEANFQAEKKIAEALQSKTEHLNLWKLGITEVPESLGRLTWLQSLNLSNNRLTTLSNSFNNLVQLQRLDLSDNSLTSLPESIGDLSQLESLSIHRNQLISLPESLGKIRGLQMLDLSINELKDIPETVARLIYLQTLRLSYNQLEAVPEWFGKLISLRELDLAENQLTAIPEQIGNLIELLSLDLAENRIAKLPKSIGQLRQLKFLNLTNNQVISLPSSIGNLENLQDMFLSSNKLKDVPSSLININDLRELNLNENPLNPELSQAYKQGIDSLKAFLRARANAQITLREAKLILIGEGEVGKTCLMDALLDNPWQDHPSTHGIQIRPIQVTDPETQKEITLNGWDFGGQRVYRPTHQLFFSAPAVYLVVWKPREGPQQGFVREWIQLVKRREPSAKIIVVATHGGPQQRQPDIDRQELWDLFGKETVVDFFFVDSKPDEQGNRKGMEELKQAIARVATTLPEVGRSVPKSFGDVRATLQVMGAPYLPLEEVFAICRANHMDDEIARLFITISHHLGHLTHYENDPALRDIVILRPDWLATAMSYVLDDEETRKAHGLVKFSRLNYLWDDPTRPTDTRYPNSLHWIFLRLMERFDLSYRVAGLSKDEDLNPISLIAQLVPDTTPNEEEFDKAWAHELAPGDIQQTQICRIVDAANGQSANAEGLFYQLIVRLHRYSLGRVHYNESVHWQRGLILDADYNGRALLRYIGNDVHITVRAAYPGRFLGMVTEEVKYLVESFWEGLRCDVTVPCLATPGCKGLFEVDKLFENQKRNRLEQPCPICNEWQSINQLLTNAPTAQKDVTQLIIAEFEEFKLQVEQARVQLSEKISYQGDKIMRRFDRLDDRTRRTLSQVDETYSDLLQMLTDEAKEGPRLFSLVPVKRSGFNLKQWTSEKFKLILWCEHIRLPLPIINGKNSQKGVYELEFTRKWFKKSAPFLKLMTSALSLALPIAVAGAKLKIDETLYKSFEDQFNFGKEIIDATLGASDKSDLWKDTGNSSDLPKVIGARAENATLRELHAVLKAKDPGFGGLVRVLNQRNEFLWVHEKFAGEY